LKSLQDKQEAGQELSPEETTQKAELEEALGDEDDNTIASRESEAAHSVNQMVPVWTKAGVAWAKSMEPKVKTAVTSKVYGLPGAWAPEEGEFLTKEDRAAVAVALMPLEENKPAEWSKVREEAERTKFTEGGVEGEIITQKIADEAGISFSDVDDMGRPAGAYGTNEWYAHQTPLAIEMAANQAINRIAAKNNNLRKLQAQYEDMKQKWKDSADKVWKEGKNVGEVQSNNKAGGENYIQATGHYWMQEGKTFRQAAADMRKHADEVYADIVKDHEVAGHKQLQSFKEEMAKLDPVFKRHEDIQQIAAKAHA